MKYTYEVNKTCLEDILVDLDIVYVHSPVKRDSDHLGNLGDLQPARHLRTVKRTEAVGQHAVLQSARPIRDQMTKAAPNQG
jgi:hypothetical protein